MLKEQEEKTDLKDQMGVHLLTLPPTVLCARYGFYTSETVDGLVV